MVYDYQSSSTIINNHQQSSSTINRSFKFMNPTDTTSKIHRVFKSLRRFLPVVLALVVLTGGLATTAALWHHVRPDAERMERENFEHDANHHGALTLEHKPYLAAAAGISISIILSLLAAGISLVLRRYQIITLEQKQALDQGTAADLSSRTYAKPPQRCCTALRMFAFASPPFNTFLKPASA